jgi:hypothetical protein
VDAVERVVPAQVADERLRVDALGGLRDEAGVEGEVGEPVGVHRTGLGRRVARGEGHAQADEHHRHEEEEQGGEPDAHAG